MILLMKPLEYFGQPVHPGVILGLARTSALPLLKPEIGYDLCADYYDDWHWQKIWGKIEWPRIEYILAEICAPSGRIHSLLDVGVGTGTSLQRTLSKFDVRKSCGVDVSSRMVGFAKSKLGEQATVKVGDASRLNFPDLSFDVIFFCRVASHLKDIRIATKELSRVLRRGGFLIVTDLDPRHPYDVTRLPFGSNKIAIETYKHSISEWKLTLTQNRLHIRHEDTIWSNDPRMSDMSSFPSSIDHSKACPLSFVVCAQKRL